MALADGFDDAFDDGEGDADGAVDALALGEALGDALGLGLGPAGASTGATRTRCAWEASQLTSLNGPVPIGASLNGSWASAAGATSCSRWSGRSGWVAAYRKPPSGVASSKLTVRESMTVRVTSRHELAPGPV